MKFLVFLCILFLVETMFLEETHVQIGLMFSLTINTLEYIEVEISFLGLQTQRVNLVVYLTASSKLAMMLQLVRAIIFDTLGSLNLTEPHCMPLLPVVLALWNTSIHVYTSNCCDKASNIKASVNQTLSLHTALNIPDVDLNNEHVIFRRDLDDSQF